MDNRSSPHPSLLVKIETQKGIEKFASDYLKAMANLPDEYLYTVTDTVYFILFVTEMEKGRDIFMNFDAVEALSSSMLLIYEKSKYSDSFSLLDLFAMSLKIERSKRELSDKYKAIYSPIIKRAILGENVNNPAYERDVQDRIERARSMAKDLAE